MLNSAEAVLGFAAWLTARDESVTFGAQFDSSKPCQLAKLFCETNSLGDVSVNWPNDLIHPKQEPTVARNAFIE